MTVPTPRREPTLESRRQGTENCRACGGAWFGAVAYCPYCGRASASAPVPIAPAAAPAAASEGPARNDSALAGYARAWKSWAKPLAVGVALGFAAVAIGALAVRFIDRQAPQESVRAPRDTQPPVQQRTPPVRGQGTQGP